MPKNKPPGTLGGGPLLPAWLRAIFAWRVVRDTGATTYWQNDVTGKRSVSRGGGHQPVDAGWLKTGEWSPPPAPPCGGSIGQRIGN